MVLARACQSVGDDASQKKLHACTHLDFSNVRYDVHVCTASMAEYGKHYLYLYYRHY